MTPKFKRVQISKGVILKSGLEEVVYKYLIKNKCLFKYEGTKITYTSPDIKKTYTPDFPIINSFIIEINTIDDTSLSITDFNPLEEFWYWIEVEDTHGYTSIGRSYSVQDYPPISPILNDIQFLDSMFYVHWSANNENDFQSYEVYESLSEDMSSSSKIFETNDIFINSLNHFQISQNQYTYYQIITTDHWGLKSSSNTKEGCSWSLFSENYGSISYCLLYTSPSPRDLSTSRMPSSA